LRFPEFHEEWEEFKLKDIAKMYDGTHQTPKYVQQGIPFYSVENVTANNFSKTKYIAKDIFEKENKRVKIEQGDILMTRIGDIGTAKYIDWNVQASFYVSLALIKPNKSYSGQYIAHYISTNKFQSELWNRTIHVAFPKKINLGEIGECLINIPCSSEQNQIAACLSLIDERIECQKKIIEGLTSFKSAVSKKIFSQELRFKDENGEYFPDWEIVQIKDIFKITRGNVLSMLLVSKEKTHDYQYPVFSSQTQNNGLAGFYNNFLFENAITWTTDGAGAGDVNYRSGKFYCTNVCGVLINQEGYANQFIAEMINSVSRKYVSYVGNPKLMNNVMSEIPIKIPMSMKEQQKISSFLVTLNQKIDLETALLQQLKLQKQYLLQQLFI